MTKAMRMMEEQLALVDGVIAVLDARAPAATYNKNLARLFGKKPLLGSKTRERVLLWGTMALWTVVWVWRLVTHDPLVWGAA